MTNHSSMPIPFEAYERLFRTVDAVAANEVKVPAKACLFFSIAGARILMQHHGLSPTVMAGFAGYNVGPPTNLALLIGSSEAGMAASGPEAHHCWIAVNGHVIDLSAPLFTDLIPSVPQGAGVPARMFQKPIVEGVRGQAGLNKPGAFVHVPNPALTMSLVRGFFESRGRCDLVSFCAKWYSRPPKAMAPLVRIANQRGEISELTLSPVRLSGAW